METVGIVVWGVLAAYCFVCVWLPEIRFLHWWGHAIRVGTVSYCGASLFFWSPLVFALKFMPRVYNTFLLSVFMFMGLVVIFIGYFVDTREP